MKTDPCKRNKHCVVWSAYGQDKTVHLCAHCRALLHSAWFSDPGDALRVVQSQAAHAKYCTRLLPYSTQDKADLAIAKMRRNR